MQNTLKKRKLLELDTEFHKHYSDVCFALKNYKQQMFNSAMDKVLEITKMQSFVMGSNSDRYIARLAELEYKNGCAGNRFNEFLEVKDYDSICECIGLAKVSSLQALNEIYVD